MPSRGRLAVALLVVAVVSLTTPLYADAVLPIEEHKSSKLLAARPVGETFDGQAVNGSEDLAGTWQDEYLVDVRRYRAQVDADRTTLFPCREAGPPAVDALERAIDEGRARTSDDAVGATLGCIDDRYAFLRGGDENETAYYEFSVATADGTTTVRTEPVEVSTVGEHVRERELVRYGELSESDRRTVDRIIESRDSGSGDGQYGGYQPVHDSPVLDRTPMLLRKGGTTYVVELYGWVDGSNLGRFLVLGVVQAVGVVALLGAIAVRWRDRQHDG